MFGDATANKYKNPFAPGAPNAGTIVVGAGNPPGDGRTMNARAEWSNYGARVDARAWGRFVHTLSAHPACNVFDGGRDACYMDYYAGTSAAGAVMSGITASIQGAIKGAGARPFNAWEMQALLRFEAVGVPQVDDNFFKLPKSMHVGPQPDLRKMIPTAILYAQQHP
jgi:microbial collagenase